MFRFTCSVALQGGRGAADKYHRPVWAALAVFRPHWVCPAHGMCATLLRLPAALWGAGPALRVIPVFGYSTKVRTWLGLHFVPSPARAAQAARSLKSTLCPGAERLIPSAIPASVSARSGWVHLVSVLGSWPLAAALPADVHHPESQKVFGSKLEACLQFGRGCRLWGRVCPFPLPPASCLWRGMSRSTAGSLFSGIAQSLCSANGRQCVRAG